MPLVLWTDALVYLLCAVIAGYIWYVRRQPHLLAPWQRVAQSAAGMAALLVLAVFIGIGLLDTLHYRPVLQPEGGEARSQSVGQSAGQSVNQSAGPVRVYAPEVRSALDALAAPLRTRVERTYSAPFATRAFQRESIEVPGPAGGTVTVREFPRLNWGGAHLAEESEAAADIMARSAAALSLGALAWGLLAGMIAAVLARRERRPVREVWQRIWRGETRIPWRSLLATGACLFALAFPAAALCTHYHILGTDKVGRDVFYLALKSIRTGMVIGTLTTLVLMPLAVGLGIAAGYFRGWLDDVIQYVYTTINSIPGVLLIAAAVLLMQVYIDGHPELFPTSEQRADFRLLFLCVILGVTGWTGLARLLRGESLKLREYDYVQAARAFGVSSVRILSRHILPNVMHIVLISLVLDFSGLVLAEVVLSYVGVGVDPTMISFGTMINSARLEMSREPMVWWSLAAAFCFMFVLVLAANLFADAVRDAFDPRVRMRFAAPAAAPASQRP